MELTQQEWIKTSSVSQNKNPYINKVIEKRATSREVFTLHFPTDQLSEEGTFHRVIVFSH